MTPQERLIETAKAEIGYIEKESNSQLDSKTANAGDNNYTKYARDLDNLGDVYNGRKNGYDWCDVFVDWCFITTFGEEIGMKLLCQAYKGVGAGCNWSAGYYKAKGQFHKADPQPGDQIFYDWDLDGSADHTGIVTEVKGGCVYTVEGNTTGPNTSASVMCSEKCRDLNYRYIFGYGRPDWNLVQEDDDDMLTYEQWKEYMDKYRKEHQDNDSGNWSEADRQWAINNELVKGNGQEIDGVPNYCWEDFATREALIAVLHRFAEQRGLE